MFSEPTFVIPKPEKKLSIEPGLVVPGAFRESPWKYFQEHGLNIKPGDTEYKEDGRISEDPTAVKCLPVWHDEAGNPIQAEVVGKDLIDLLTELQSVKLDSSVLRTAAFTSLVDYSIGLPDLPLGRNNPFEKISGSVSTPVVAPKTQVKR